MSSITLLFIFVPILVIILLMANVLLAVHRPDTEKVTAYECGFSPIYGQTRAPFSIQYYLVGILFLIFDLEILLLYPIRVTLYNVSLYGFWVAVIFFTVLTLGFVYELGKGRLYFTDQRSAINRTSIESSSNPLPKFSNRTGSKDKKFINIRKMHTGVHSHKVINAISKGLPKEAFNIALTHIEKGTPTTVEVINSILNNFRWSITSLEFDKLIALPKKLVPLPLKSNLEASNLIGRDLPSNHPDYNNNRKSGIYLFSYNNELYVGSSIYLGRRVRQYFKPGVTKRETRPVI